MATPCGRAVRSTSARCTLFPILLPIVLFHFVVHSVSADYINYAARFTALADSTQCPTPYDVAFDPLTGIAFVSCSGAGGSVLAINGTTIRPLTSSTECIPYGLEYDPARDLLYVACRASFNPATVLSIKPSDPPIIRSLVAVSTQCGTPTDVTYNPQTGAVYATCYGPADGSNAVIWITVSGGSITVDPFISTTSCQATTSAAFNEVTGTLAVTCSDASNTAATVVTRDSNGTLSRRVLGMQCKSPTGLTWDKGSNTIYVACTGSGSIKSIVGTAISQITSNECPQPSAVRYDSTAGLLYATCSTPAGGSIVVINTTSPSATVSPAAAIDQCPTAFGLDFDSNRQMLYATCLASPSTRAVVAINVSASGDCNLGSYWNFPNCTCITCASGSYSASRTQSSCTLCGMGTFNQLTNQSACTNCAVGKYSQAIGSSTPASCLPAPPGRYVSDRNRTSAVPCPGGTYNPYYNQSICIGCIAGTYSPLIGQTSNTTCVACAAGSYSNTYAAFSVNFCSPCAPGTASPDKGVTFCPSCPAGTFASTAGTYTCMDCPANTYSSITGSSSQDNCLPCPPSQPNSLPGSSSVRACQVLTCQAGWYPSSNASVICDQPCPRGTFCQNSKKIPCWPGSFSAIEGQTSCQLCDAGKFSLEMGSNSSSSCLDCPQGSFGIVTGQAPTSCIACPPGTANNNTGSSTKSDCINCARGTYAAFSGSVNCEPCAVAYYQDSEGQVTCTACPANTYSSSATTGAIDSSICTKCRPGTSSSPGSSSVSACLQQTCAVGLYGDLCDIPCEVGHYCDGSTQMKACAPGMYQDQTQGSICRSCAIGRFNPATASATANSCLPCPLNTFNPFNASVACVACPYSSYTNFTAATNSTDCQYDQVTINTYSLRLQAAGQIAFANQQKQQQQQEQSSGGSDGGNGAEALLSLAPTPLYADSSVTTSLRLAAFGEDSYLVYASQLRAVDPLSSAINSSVLVICIAVLVVVASIPLLFYRRLPSSVARHIDQFALTHRLQDGEPVIKKPTKWGAAVSWAFIPIAVLVGIILGSQSNSVVSRALLPSFNQPTTAVGSVQLTLRAFGDTSSDSSASSSAGHMCINSPSYQSFKGASGFSSTPFIRSLVSNTDSSCSIAIDCINCSLTGVGNWTVAIPFRYQLVEYEIWTTGAEIGQQARMYGILLPNPQVTMLDQSSQLQFSLLNAFYKDDRNGNEQQQQSSSTSTTSSSSTTNSSAVNLPSASTLFTSNSGFEIAYQYYSTVTAANVSRITPDSTTTVAFLFNPSSIIYQTSVSSKSSIVQLLFSILASIVSLFSLFAILFKGSSFCMTRLLNWSMVDVSLLAMYKKKSDAQKGQQDPSSPSNTDGPLQVSPIIAANQTWNEFVDQSEQYSRSRTTVDGQARVSKPTHHPMIDTHASPPVPPPSQGIEMTERMLDHRQLQTQSDQDVVSEQQGL